MIILLKIPPLRDTAPLKACDSNRNLEIRTIHITNVNLYKTISNLFCQKTMALSCINPLNAHAAKAKLTWQRVSCRLNQSDKILSMTREADPKFVVCSTHNHWL